MNEAATLERPAPWHNGGESAMRDKGICSVPACERPSNARGYCRMHWQRWARHGDPLGLVPRLSVAERFWAKVVPYGDCWLWQGTRARGGYGRFWSGTRYVQATRWVYEHEVGSIPDDFKLDHLCRNTGCVNPHHLEAVTNQENSRRGLRGVLTTHCPHGHPYSGQNLQLSAEGWRRCRRCKTIWKRSYRQRLAAAKKAEVRGE